MSIKDKINFRQPKYMLPAILYLPLLLASYLMFDLFTTKKAEIPDETLQVTDYLNPEIPDATIKGGDGIGSKYENMTKSWGKIADYSAVDIIERDEPEEFQEKYESQYTEDDLLQIEQQQEEAVSSQIASEREREKEALAELEKALAEARLRGQQSVAEALEASERTEDDGQTEPPVQNGGVISEDRNAVSAIADNEPTTEAVKVVKKPSDYFNTISQSHSEPKMIQAIIDENITAVDGSRVRLRLLDDIQIGERTVRRGSYLYAIMSGFSAQRVKGNIGSILVGDELVKVSLTLYDTDGMEGLYVPQSQFRETTKDVASVAAQGNMNFNNGSSDNPLLQWGMQAAQNAYQRTTSAVAKSIKRNKAKLKYGTFVYIINSKDIK